MVRISGVLFFVFSGSFLKKLMPFQKKSQSFPESVFVPRFSSAENLCFSVSQFFIGAVFLSFSSGQFFSVCHRGSEAPKKTAIKKIANR